MTGDLSGLSEEFPDLLRKFPVNRPGAGKMAIRELLQKPNRDGAPKSAKKFADTENGDGSLVPNPPVCGVSDALKGTVSKTENDWRRGRDSNPRYPCEYIGFRDRRDRPLRHLSAPGSLKGGELSRRGQKRKRPIGKSLPPARFFNSPRPPRRWPPPRQRRAGTGRPGPSGFYFPAPLSKRSNR